jgi:hypothetical protein
MEMFSLGPLLEMPDSKVLVKVRLSQLNLLLNSVLDGQWSMESEKSMSK